MQHEAKPPRTGIPVPAVGIVAPMRNLRALPRTVVTLVIGFLATLAAAFAAFVLGHVRPTSPAIEKVTSWWARAWLVPAGVDLEVRGVEHVDPSRSYVVVANHLSNIDIMVCFAAIPLPIRFLAKKELFRVPLLAQGMRSIGIVEVDRQHVRGPAAIEAVNRQAQVVIERGHSLIVYPEGTRSRDAHLRPFKKGAFSMAVGADMPVLPVTLHGTWEVWEPSKPWIRPGRVTVVIDPPIETENLTRDDVTTIRNNVRDIIASHLEDLDRAG